MLTHEQISKLRTQLTAWQEDLGKRIKENEHFGMEYAMVKDSVRELSNYDNHPADTGTAEFERGKDLALNEHAEKELDDVAKALESIRRGSYGTCEVCHTDIPYERLEAIPTTTRCVKHAEEHFVSEKRPVEEDVLRPPFGQFEYDEKDATLYDAEDAWQDVARYGTSETPSDFAEQAMLDYNDMYIESDEPVGYVEEIEGFLITDLEGNFIGVNDNHHKYEAFLDNAHVTSIYGDAGIEGVDYMGEDQE
jgi:YteA family regulatory protein